MCSETSEAVGTTWEHAQSEFQKFLKIRIPLLNKVEPLKHHPVTNENTTVVNSENSEGI